MLDPLKPVIARTLRIARGGLAGAAVVACALLAGAVAADARNWILDPAASKLTYQSVKKNTIVETNSIRNISGSLSENGAGKIVFDLDSVDTGVDLRNVRMRFLFFETFKFPTATVTANVDPAAFADLPTRRRMSAKLPFRLDMHGVVKDLEANVVVTMISETMVSIASETPIAVKVEDFGLLPNVEKLQIAANVTNIVPVASVSFDFVFNAEGVTPPVVVVATTEGSTDVGPVATDAAKSEFSQDECLNRFEVISRTGAIYFRSGSARLDRASKPLIDAVVDVVGKCPGLNIEISGHTDSDGPDAYNQQLSEKRAQSVMDAVVAGGINAGQLRFAGYGETQPVAPNDSWDNKQLNRRIEFTVVN
jgi:outer membrane protein OmpA-like peptidoglycan-associated protein